MSRTGITTINPIPERRHLRSDTSSRTDFDSVVDRFAQLLLASDVAFVGLDRNVPKKKLDLLWFSTCAMAQTRTTAT
jgi:hypothetical protein